MLIASLEIISPICEIFSVNFTVMTFLSILISPASEIKWNENTSYDTYGFSGEGAKEYYRDLVIHELCHPFVTPFIESEK